MFELIKKKSNNEGSNNTKARTNPDAYKIDSNGEYEIDFTLLKGFSDEDIYHDLMYLLTIHLMQAVKDTLEETVNLCIYSGNNRNCVVPGSLTITKFPVKVGGKTVNKLLK